MAQFGNDHTSDGLGDRTGPIGGEHYNNKLNQVDEKPDMKTDLLELRLEKASKKAAQSIAYPPDGTYPANLAHVIASIERWAEALLENHRWTEQSQRKWLRQLGLDVLKIVELERECSSNDYAESLYQLRKHTKRV